MSQRSLKRWLAGWSMANCLWFAACNHSGDPTPPEQSPSPTLAARQTQSSEQSQSNLAPKQHSSGASQTVAPELFTDVTVGSGVSFSYKNGRSAGEFAILESLGGGVGLTDCDNDGRLDIFVGGGGDLRDHTITPHPCGLYSNRGDFQFADVTTAAHAASDRFFNHGPAAGDFDNDGYQDIAVSGYGGVQLLHNLGDGTFAQLPSLTSDVAVPWSSSLAWGDLDGNGLLDLYVAHYVDWSWQNHPRCAGQGNVPREVCTPKDFSGVQDVIYFNDGTWPWRADTSALGTQPNGKALGVVVCDVNADGVVDIYVANDTTDNYLYINDGDGRFTESAVLAGVSGDDRGVSTGSMGIAILDANADTRPDILVTNFERELTALYRNDGESQFTFASRQVGLAAYEATFVGFGVISPDINFDGYPDMVIANGHVSYASPFAPYRQVPLLFINEGGTRFQRIQTPCFDQAMTGRGLAGGDLNDDGAVDLVISNLEDPVRLFRAATPAAAQWASVQLVGQASNRNAIGAMISFTHDGRTQTKFVCGGGSYLSQNDYRQLFYWPPPEKSVQPMRVTVQWPSKQREQFSIRSQSHNVLVEGTGQNLDGN